MMPRSLLTGLLAMTVGCAASPPPEGEEVPARAGGGCDAIKAQSLVGQPASEALARSARELSGAGKVRWLVPGQMVTMEFRADRLNIELDRENRVVAIRCG